MIVVNFFGAPGSGKTTAALGLAGRLKRAQMNAEYVSEFAKDQVWAKSAHLLQKQNWVFANQDLRLSMLRGQVDFVVTDSPLPLSVFYVPDDYPPSFSELCFHFFEQYENVNFFLRRSHDYSPIGRLQSEQEAIAMDARMHGFLITNGIPFEEIDAGDAEPDLLMERLRALGVAKP
jgi:RecA/RadA recombinase